MLTIYGYSNNKRKTEILKKNISLNTKPIEKHNIQIIINGEEIQSNIHDYYLVIDFIVSDDTDGGFGIDVSMVNFCGLTACWRLMVNYGPLTLSELNHHP